MGDLAQIDRIISEVNDLDENEKIIFFNKIEEIFNNTNKKEYEEITIKSAFGLWKDRNVTKETLRKKAWNVN